MKCEKGWLVFKNSIYRKQNHLKYINKSEKNCFREVKVKEKIKK